MPTLKLGPLTIPVGRTTARWLGLVAVVAAVAGTVLHLWPEWSALVSASDADARARATVAEYATHLGDPIEREMVVFDDRRGSLTIGAYDDGCLLVRRRVSQAAAVQVRLIPDVARDPLPSAAAPGQHSWRLMPTVWAGGRCLNPHPGKVVRQTYGERRDCWVEVRLVWDDACEAAVWYDVCRDVWQTDKDGQPVLRWLACRH